MIVLRICYSLVLLMLMVGVNNGTSAEQFSFEGYKVWQVAANSEAQYHLLSQWEHKEHVDFWEPLPKTTQTTRVMVASGMQSNWLNFLVENEIQHKLIIEDVERTFEEEREYDNQYKLNRLQSDADFEFNHYWELDEMDEYIEMLKRDHSDIVSVEVLGNSSQDRPLRIINISLAGRGIVNGSRPIVLIEAGVHGRKWISHHAALYVLRQLIENRSANIDILEAVDFIVIPIVNPDGYRYSRFAYRMWRKTMREFDVNEIGLVCYGVDGDRNYEFMWRNAQDSQVTTCNETYPGTEPFSEPETRAVQFVLDRHSTDIKMFLTLHAPGNYVLYPWAAERALVRNWYLHERVAHIFADTIFAETGTNYTVGSVSNLFGHIYGTAVDYASFVGVQASISITLPGGGETSFEVPASQLEEVLRETWSGLRNVLVFAGEHNWEEY